jgi:hypothetical protein
MSFIFNLNQWQMVVASLPIATASRQEFGVKKWLYLVVIG